MYNDLDFKKSEKLSDIFIQMEAQILSKKSFTRPVWNGWKRYKKPGYREEYSILNLDRKIHVPAYMLGSADMLSADISKKYGVIIVNGERIYHPDQPVLINDLDYNWVPIDDNHRPEKIPNKENFTKACNWIKNFMDGSLYSIYIKGDLDKQRERLKSYVLHYGWDKLIKRIDRILNKNIDPLDYKCPSRDRFGFLCNHR